METKCVFYEVGTKFFISISFTLCFMGAEETKLKLPPNFCHLERNMSVFVPPPPPSTHLRQQRNGRSVQTLMVLVHSNVLPLSGAFQFSLIFSLLLYLPKPPFDKSPSCLTLDLQERLCTDNVTLRCGRLTIASVEKQWVLDNLSVFICSLSYPVRNAHAPYCHLWPARLYNNFYTLSYKRHVFRKNVTEHKMCVLIFSTTFVSNIFHSWKKWARYDKKNVY